MFVDLKFIQINATDKFKSKGTVGGAVSLLRQINYIGICKQSLNTKGKHLMQKNVLWEKSNLK